MRRRLSGCDTGGEPRACYAGCHKWRGAGACGCHCGSVSGRFRTGVAPPSFATLSQFINGNVFVRSRPWTSPDPATSYTKAMGANRGQLCPSREPLNFTAASLM
jgi:hypothetical protein